MPDLAEVRKRLNENPSDARALRAAARYYLEEGSYKQAQNCYAQAVNNDPRIFPGVRLDYEARIEAQPEKTGPRLSLAGFLLAVDEEDSALLEIEELLELEPKNVEAYNVLGRIYVKRDRIDEAITLLERSIAEGVRDVSLTEILAAAYLGKGRITEAVKFYEEIVAQKPGDKQTLRMLGELYTRLENYNQAARCYREMFSDDPEVVREVIQRLEDLLKKVEGNVEIREILADIYMKALVPEAAVEKLKEIARLEATKINDVLQKLRNILRNYPGLPSAMLVLAEALQRQGDYSEAVENYYQLVRTKPEFINDVIAGYRQVLAACPAQVLARSYLGEALLGQGKVAEALEELSLMVAADPGTAETVIKRCRDILRGEPQLLRAHVVLGQAYLAKADFQRAAVEAEGVVSLDKNSTGAFLLLGEAYGKLNLPRKAAQALRTALALDPYNIQVHQRYRDSRLRDVSAEIEKLKGDEWKASSHLELAKLYLIKGEREEAIRELQAAQRDAQRAPTAGNLLGNIYRSEGKYEMAAAQYNRALEAASPELARLVCCNLGSVNEAVGQVRKAIKLYEGIMQEEIDFGNLKKKVKQLKSTSLQSMRNRPLQLAIAEFGRKELIGFWGREPRPASRAGGREEVNVSFGQEHNQEGVELFFKGMYTAAEEELTLAVQLDRNFSVAVNNLGVALARQGKLEEARLRLGEAVQLDPASVVFYNNLGVVLFLLGRTEAGQVALEKSQALDPESAAVALNLADIYYAKQDARRAIELYRKIGQFDLLSDLAASRLLFTVP